MAPKVKKKDPVFAKIVHGRFPEKALKSISRERLEQCVVDLVIYSSASKTSDRKQFLDLYERLCVNKHERPKWWPSDHDMSHVLTPDGIHLMKLLRFLAYKCCEYFKKPSADLGDQENQLPVKPKRNPTCKPFDAIKPSSSVRRNVGTQYTLPNSPAIEISEGKQPCLTQDEFLGLSRLRRTSNTTVSDSRGLHNKAHHSVKFVHCPAIPFSSDLGIELMKRDAHTCPDETKIKYLQKRERYTNTISAPSSNSQCPISYKTKRTGKTDRKYHFPKRQNHQHPGDLIYQLEKIFCKPCKVHLNRLNLTRIKEKICPIRKFTGNTKKKQVCNKRVKRKPLHDSKKDIYVILDRL